MSFYVGSDTPDWRPWRDQFRWIIDNDYAWHIVPRANGTWSASLDTQTDPLWVKDGFESVKAAMDWANSKGNPTKAGFEWPPEEPSSKETAWSRILKSDLGD